MLPEPLMVIPTFAHPKRGAPTFISSRRRRRDALDHAVLDGIRSSRRELDSSEQVGTPRFVKYSGVEAPKAADLKDHPRPKGRAPLHAKPEAIGTIQLAELVALSMHQSVRDRLQRALRWLQCPILYAQLAARFSNLTNPRQPRATRLAATDIEMLLAIHRVEVSEKLAFGCNVFTVFEWAKHRRRLIIEPMLNDVIYDEDIEPVTLPRNAQLRRMANQKYFCQFDAKAFYDQFLLDKEIRPYFGFGVKQLVSSCLPMGFRPACFVAQATAEALLSFDMEGDVDSCCYIDNFYFSSNSKKDLIAACKVFLDRCAACGVQLNSTDITITEDFDALGERFRVDGATRGLYDGNGSVQLTDTTISKIEMALETLAFQDRENISYRRCAAIFGIAFYGSKVLSAPPSFAFNALRFYRECVACTSDWSAAAPRIVGYARHELENWLRILRCNHAVSLAEADETAVPDVELFSDASAWGWGTTALRHGITSQHSVPWSSTEKMRWDCTSSVAAEPLALVNSASATVRPSDRVVRIHTDHLPLVHAFRKGYGKALSYNSAIVELQSRFPHVQFVVVFVPGISNPADRLSRGFWDWREEAELGWEGG